jgi:hypothetical protein
MRPWDWKAVSCYLAGGIVVNTDQKRQVRALMQSGMSQQEAILAIYGDWVLEFMGLSEPPLRGRKRAA